jgi:hypothetical protein
MNIVHIVNFLSLIVTYGRRRISTHPAWSKPTLHNYYGSLYSGSKGRRASEIHSINIRTCDGEQRSE